MLPHPLHSNGAIYVGGASDYQGGLVVDTTNSFSFDPVANTIGTIAAIPRATGETRALTFNAKSNVCHGRRQSRAQPLQRSGRLRREQWHVVSKYPGSCVRDRVA